jgi:iron complex outermembrane receptor protein
MGTYKTNRVRVAAAVFALSALPLNSALCADPKMSLSVDIGSQPLEAALVELSKQGHLQLVIATNSLPTKLCVPLHGNMPLGAALDFILKDTGLTYRLVGDHTIAIVKSAGPTSQLSDPPASPGASGATGPTTQSHDGSVDQVVRANNANRGDQTVNHRGFMLRLTTLLGICVSASVSGPACAQSATNAESDTALEEIIVTAQRREENQQTVPIAVTVISQQALQQNNVQTIGDLQYLVPSLSASTALTRDALNVSIRAQGSNSVSSLPGVVAYLNEVPIPTDQDGNLAGGPGLLFDLENVQVLKGPQGTLFGRNSVGGALLLQTARPTNEFGGTIQATYGNYDDREIEGAINIPILDDTLLTRIAFNGQLRDGFTQILAEPGHANGIDADNRDNWSTRATVTFRPSEWFQNESIATLSKYNSYGSPLILTQVNPSGLLATIFPSINALFAQQQAAGARTAIPIDTRDESSGQLLSLSNISRATLSDAITFRNIFGFDDAIQVLALDADATALPLIDLPSTPRHVVVRQFTDEAQFLGTSLAGHLDWIAGAFYLDQPSPGYSIQTATEFFAPSASAIRKGDQSKALYAQGTYDLSAMIAGLKFIAGARYTWDEASNETGPCTEAARAGPVTNCAPIALPSVSTSAPTWTVGVEDQVNRDTLVYLTSRRGYRAGGTNGDNAQGNPLPDFSPEYVEDVELGLKSDWKLGPVPMRTNADVYYQDYRDIQVTQTVFNGLSPTALTANAASARVYGAELEAIVQLTKDLRVGVNFDYLSFKYTNFGSGVDSAQLTGASDSPPRKYGVSARYQLPVGDRVGDISVRANWNWQAQSGSVAQIYGGVIPAFGLLNLSADWNGIRGTSFDASLFASNALNKVYVVGGFSFVNSLGFAEERFGEPRFYGLRLRYRFGATH